MPSYTQNHSTDLINSERLRFCHIDVEAGFDRTHSHTISFKIAQENFDHFQHQLNQGLMLDASATASDSNIACVLGRLG